MALIDPTGPTQATDIKFFEVSAVTHPASPDCWFKEEDRDERNSS